MTTVASQHDHAVDGFDQAIEPVIDDEDGLPTLTARQQRMKAPRGFRREMRGRLVGDEERRLLHEGRRQRDELAFAARELRGAALAPFLRHADLSHDLCDGLRNALRRQGAVLEREGDFVLDAHAAKRLVRILEILRHLACPVPRPLCADIRAEEADMSAHLGGYAVGNESRQRQQQRGLARARWPKQQNPLALPDRQINRPDRGTLGEGIENLGLAPLRGGLSASCGKVAPVFRVERCAA